MNKRAVSPAVATSLLIVMVIVLASIVFFAAKSLIKEQLEKFGRPIEDICAEVNFKTDYQKIMGRTINLEIVNHGNIPIHNVEIEEFDGKGNSWTNNVEFFIEKGGTLNQNFILRSSDIEKIKIYPRVLGNVRGEKSNKAFTCLEQGKTLNLM